MDYSYRVEQANDYDYPDYAASQLEPYDEDAIKWSAIRTMAHGDDYKLAARATMQMARMVGNAADSEIAKLHEIIELMASQNQRLRDENATLKESIAALETEHVPAPHCDHGLPKDCCKICVKAYTYERNANVRADGEYQE